MNAPLPEHIRRALETVTLDDKYSQPYGRVFMSGIQALVRLPMLQRERDAEVLLAHADDAGVGADDEARVVGQVPREAKRGRAEVALVAFFCFFLVWVCVCA